MKTYKGEATQGQIPEYSLGHKLNAELIQYPVPSQDQIYPDHPKEAQGSVWRFLRQTWATEEVQ